MNLSLKLPENDNSDNKDYYISEYSPVELDMCKFCNKIANNEHIYHKKIKIGENENGGIYKYQKKCKVHLCNEHFQYITSDYSYKQIISSKNNKVSIPIGKTIYAKKLTF
jgi:hypothetical protein